jgi:hypothetical protein
LACMAWPAGLASMALAGQYMAMIRAASVAEHGRNGLRMYTARLAGSAEGGRE